MQGRSRVRGGRPNIVCQAHMLKEVFHVRAGWVDGGMVRVMKKDKGAGV